MLVPIAPGGIEKAIVPYRLFLQAVQKLDAYSDELQKTRKGIVRVLDTPAAAGIFNFIVI